MGSKTFFAFFAIALTAVLAAPAVQQSQNAIQVQTKPADIRAGLGELIAAVEKAVDDVRNAIARADAGLVKVLAESPKVVAQVQGVLDSAVAEAEQLIVDIVAAHPGLTLEQLVKLLGQTAGLLEGIAVAATAEVVEIVVAGAPQLLSEVQAVLGVLATDVQTAVQPVVDIIATLEPGKALSGPQDALEDLIVLIGALLGVDVPAIVEQVPRTIAGIQAALTGTVNELATLLGNADVVLKNRLDAAVAQAVVRADAIVQPLLDILAPLLPANQRQVAPQDLLDELLKLVLGVTLQELTDLIESTDAQLEQLLLDTIAEIQGIVLGYPADLANSVNQILDNGVARVEAEVAPLVALLSPFFPPESAKNRGVNLGEIIRTLRRAVVDVKSALVSAGRDVKNLLAGTGLVGDASVLLRQAAREAEQVVRRAIASAPGLSRPELVSLVRRTVATLERGARRTLANLEKVVRQAAAGKVPELKAVGRELLADLKAAVRPVLALLKPLLPTSVEAAQPIVKSSLGEIIAQLNATITGINAAVLKANDELNVLLTGYGLYAPIEEIILESEQQSNALILEAINTATTGVSLEELIALVQDTVLELELIQAQAAGKVQALIRESDAPELLPEITLITIQLQDDIKAQLQALLDVLIPPAASTTEQVVTEASNSL